MTGFKDGPGASACFNEPMDVVVTVNDDIFVSDSNNHVIRVITPQGSVHTLYDNGQGGYTVTQRSHSLFNYPYGLALNAEENLLVADYDNHVIRHVTMSVVIVVSDWGNHRLHKIVVGQVTTLTDRSESGTTDGAGAVTLFNRTYRLTLDDHGRLLVTEFDRKDTLRVVEVSLTSPLWMGPVEETTEDVETVMTTKTQAKLPTLEDYGTLVEDGTLENKSTMTPRHWELISTGISGSDGDPVGSSR